MKAELDLAEQEISLLREELRILGGILSGPVSESEPIPRTAIYTAGLLSCLAGTSSYPGIGTALSSSLSARARIPRIAVSSVIAPKVASFFKEMLPDRITVAEN